MQKYYFVVPFIYIVIVCILFFNYIFEPKQIDFQWGDITISVTTEESKDRELLSKIDKHNITNIPISKAKVTLPYGFFIFDSSSSISQQNAHATLTSISALPSQDGFVLAFNDIVYITFHTNIATTTEVGMVIQTLDDYMVEIPFKTLFGINSSIDSEALLLSHSSYNIQVFSSLYGAIQPERKNWVFTNTSDYASFHFSLVSEQLPQTITAIPLLAPTNKKDTEDIIEIFIDNVYEGWVQNRFDSATGTWIHPEGFKGFSEAILISTYAEAQRRNEIANKKNSIG